MFSWSGLTNRQKFIIGAGALFVIVFLFLIISGLAFKGGSKFPTATLNVWGVYDNSSVWDSFFGQFHKLYPSITLKYKQVPFDEYETDIINGLASGQGPDIFYIHNTWLPKFKDKLMPEPAVSDLMDYKTYTDSFVDVVVNDFTDASKIYGVPLYVDTLGFYYNKDLYNASSIAIPPKTWEDFNNDVTKLTSINASGDIVHSATALGTATNINRSTDILSLLMLQSSGSTPLVDAKNKKVNFDYQQGSVSPGLEALRFYTDFANPALQSYTWNDKMDYSIDAFVAGKTASMFNYSHHLATVRHRAPQLNFGVASMPQPAALLAQNQRVDYANYFGLGVARTDDSAKAEAAWTFLNFMSEQAQQKAYVDSVKVPSARRDLINEFRDDIYMDIFAQQALTAKSWYQPDNVAIETIFAENIEAVAKGDLSVPEALSRMRGQVEVLLSRGQ